MKQFESYLSMIDQFEKPKIELEQYCTPVDITAELFSILQFDHDAFADKVVGDFCAGTCMYSIAACYFEPTKVVALELDLDAMAIAMTNLEDMGCEEDVEIAP